MSVDGKVLLVGSVPFDSEEEVMRTCGKGLGELAVSFPDGEPGDRSRWIIFQAYRIFDQHPQLKTVGRPEPAAGKPDWVPSGLADFWKFELKDGVNDLTFDDLRYASIAKDSYRTFTDVRGSGDIPENARFQVCLPLPESGCSWFFQDPDLLQTVIPAYEQALTREIDKIVESIPHADLTIQFDVCWEVLDAEGVFPWALPEDPLARLAATVQRVGSRIPEDVPVGYHFCYADLGHEHMKEPEDLGLAVRMANIAVKHSGRAVDWVHLPVPRNRADEGYFQPLRELDPRNATVFLGLVHHTDGIEGTNGRIAVAQRFLRDFGIATECGFGRRDPGTVPELLRIHREAAAAIR